jgi:hypothetical protein
MKNVRLMMMTLMMCLMTMVSFGQSRTNVDKIDFLSKTEKLTKATGWEQNKTTGEWVSNKNVIDYQECKPYWVSHVSQNFKWLQFSIVERNGNKYYVFLYEKLSGKYKYPNIQQDWETETQTHFFIITESEFKEFKDFFSNNLMHKNAQFHIWDLGNNVRRLGSLNNGKTIQLKSKMNGFITDSYKVLGGEHLYNEENLLSKIRNVIDKPNYLELCFTLNSQFIDGSNVIRFRLPESCYSTGENIKTKYFEVLNEDFQKILFQ